MTCSESGCLNTPGVRSGMCRLHYRRKWKRENRDLCRAQERRYEAANPERMRAKWHRKHAGKTPEQKEKHKNRLLTWLSSLPLELRKKLKNLNSEMKRSRLEKATPSWANLNQIREVYRNRPDGFEVDHIIPLRGKGVCGLHVPHNLQYLPKAENRKKGNKY